MLVSEPNFVLKTKSDPIFVLLKRKKVYQLAEPLMKWKLEGDALHSTGNV